MSSLMTRQSCPRTAAAMPSSVARENTAPVGLLGLLMMIARVRGVSALRMASGSGAKPSSSRVWTMTGLPPASCTMSG